MHKTTKCRELLKQLFSLFKATELVGELLMPIFRVVAAVQLFFRTGDYPAVRRAV